MRTLQDLDPAKRVGILALLKQASQITQISSYKRAAAAYDAPNRLSADVFIVFSRTI
jgi:hypothetical protein